MCSFTREQRFPILTVNCVSGPLVASNIDWPDDTRVQLKLSNNVQCGKEPDAALTPSEIAKDAGKVGSKFVFEGAVDKENDKELLLEILSWARKDGVKVRCYHPLTDAFLNVHSSACASTYNW